MVSRVILEFYVFDGIKEPSASQTYLFRWKDHFFVAASGKSFSLIVSIYVLNSSLFISCGSLHPSIMYVELSSYLDHATIDMEITILYIEFFSLYI